MCLPEGVCGGPLFRSTTLFFNPEVLHWAGPNYCATWPSFLTEHLYQGLSLARGLGPPCASVVWQGPGAKSVDGNWHRDAQFVIPVEADEKQFLAEQAASGRYHYNPYILL
jgi:hypothetical protein